MMDSLKAKVEKFQFEGTDHLFKFVLFIEIL